MKVEQLQKRKRINFQAVRDEVKRRIEGGVWPVGAQLPTEVQLAAEFGCARATVNRALGELVEQGYVERRRKSGTRVTLAPVRRARIDVAPARQAVLERNAAYRYALVLRDRIEAPAWLSSQLGLPSGAPVLHLQCMHYGDNHPFQFEERWVNIAAVPEIEQVDLDRICPNEWLLRAAPFTDAEISFAAVAADRRLAGFLATTSGTPLIQMERTTWLRGAAVTFVRMTHHAGFRLRSRH